MLKNKTLINIQENWQPSATFANLRLRAEILKKIRDFFSARDVMEVETPVLCHTSVTDPFIQSIPAYFQSHSTQSEECYYLQTSPEYAMKRLLAAGSGSIYQITKAFRQGEVGRFHNPEFTMLEWYRTGYDHHSLMNEMDELLQFVLESSPAEKHTYAETFLTYLNIDPHAATIQKLKECAEQQKLDISADIDDKDTWLNLLLSHCIEPHLGREKPYFIYDFPASQSALARINNDNPNVASRFEVYINGIELANGFHELQDANEQRKRFEQNLVERAKLNLKSLPIDNFFLAALENGLPDCAGVALGIDRLIMLAAKSNAIQQVLSFDFTRV